MQIESTTSDCQDIDTQALVIPVFKDEKPDQGFLKNIDAASGGIVNSVIEAEELQGKEGETVYFHLLNNDQLKAQRLLLVGVGEEGDYTRTQVSQMAGTAVRLLDRKSTRLNSSHSQISYAVFCLKKKKNDTQSFQTT